MSSAKHSIASLSRSAQINRTVEGRHWSLVIGHLSLVICHLSFVICHLS
ncbi:MAG: hypothetical protein HEQ19_08000 [Gloeotrichia echinulata CP02]